VVLGGCLRGLSRGTLRGKRGIDGKEKNVMVLSVSYTGINAGILAGNGVVVETNNVLLYKGMVVRLCLSPEWYTTK
jgi:hypothetical protein